MYIQAQDLTDVMDEITLRQLSTDNSRATEVNQAVIAKACEYATETVDGYLRARYLLPLNQVPGSLLALFTSSRRQGLSA